ncbi:MAG TPA: phosphatidylglycerophosphatase A [Bdellovibrionota bacterium]
MRKAVEELGVAWATFFYVGRSPKAPGTMGSIAALPLAWYVWQLEKPVAWIVVLFVFVAGVAGAAVVHKRTGQSDHQSIVVDEVVGILITTSVAGHSWQHFLLAFVLFRIFDIWKPWPASWVDRNWHTPVGTMMDDVVAAAMATVILFLILFFAPGWPAA